MSIQYLNPQPPTHETPPITTRPELLPNQKYLAFTTGTATGLLIRA